MDNKNYEEVFTRPIIKIGRFTNLFAVVTCFIPAIVMWLKFDAFPGFAAIGEGWVMVLSTYLLIAVIEAVSYFPVLGLSGTYMGFLAGNIGNMRVPCSAMAQEAIGTTPGSKKAELVSTLGIAGSVVTNTIVVFVAAIGGKALTELFPPVVLEAFGYVAPAIFGAVFGLNAVKHPKIGIYSLVLCLVMLVGIQRIPPALMIPINVFSCIGLSVFLYKKKKKAEETNNTK